jgi:hypothetical protein
MRQKLGPDKFIHIARMAHQIEVGHTVGNFLGGIKGLAAQQDHLGPCYGGIADKMNLIYGHIGQHSNRNGLANIQEVTEPAGQIDCLQILRFGLG